jgi:RNA polymerase sigma-70 factor (ECF subfamily)
MTTSSPLDRHFLDPPNWIDNHSDVLMGYAMLRVRNPEKAQDLVQDTLVAAWQGRDSFQGECPERTWLIGILKHKIVDAFRKNWREQPASEIQSDLEDDGLMDRMFDEKGMWKNEMPQEWNDPRQRLDTQDLLDHLNRCFKNLPTRLGEVFILRELEQWDGNRICQVLGINPTNLWQLLHRARTRLRTCLEKAGFGLVEGEVR